MAIEIIILVVCTFATGWVWFFPVESSSAPLAKRPLRFLGIIIEYRQNTHWTSILLVVVLTAGKCYPPFTHEKVLLILSGVLLLIARVKIMDLKVKLLA
jgi:hypothetical protein